MQININPIDDPVQKTLDALSVAILAMLGSKTASILDAGQFEMLKEAEKRITQVVTELDE